MAVTRMAIAPTPYRPPPMTPPVGVADPSTFYQKALLQPYLDPSSPAYYGNAYTPQYKGAAEKARAGLAGLGGFTWGVDDPSTPQDESLGLSYDDQAPLGERQLSAVHSEQAAMNARGVLYSSLTNQHIGAALGRLTEQGRAVVNQYASDISSISNAESTQGFNLYSGLAQLYGQDAIYSAQNPPAAAPPPAPLPGPTSAQPTLTGGAKGGLANASAFKNIDSTVKALKPNTFMDYQTFVKLHGGVPTEHLTEAWKAALAARGMHP